jgi:anti-sigma28 factor (negative regulator of flagellin synthesis)
MAYTGRQTTRKLPSSGKGAITETHSGEEIARSSRIEELRRLVAAGRYEVEPHKLAIRILARALQQAK